MRSDTLVGLGVEFALYLGVFVSAYVALFTKPEERDRYVGSLRRSLRKA